MITDLIHICTKQFGNECVFSPVQSIEIADDFGGEFLVRIDEKKEEFKKEVDIREEMGSFLRVKSSLLKLSSIREQMKIHFLILALID